MPSNTILCPLFCRRPGKGDADSAWRFPPNEELRTAADIAEAIRLVEGISERVRREHRPRELRCETGGTGPATNCNGTCSEPAISASRRPLRHFAPPLK